MKALVTSQEVKAKSCDFVLVYSTIENCLICVFILTVHRVIYILDEHVLRILINSLYFGIEYQNEGAFESVESSDQIYILGK